MCAAGAVVGMKRHPDPWLRARRFDEVIRWLRALRRGGTMGSEGALAAVEIALGAASPGGTTSGDGDLSQSAPEHGVVGLDASGATWDARNKESRGT